MVLFVSTPVYTDKWGALLNALDASRRAAPSPYLIATTTSCDSLASQVDRKQALPTY